MFFIRFRFLGKYARKNQVREVLLTVWKFRYRPELIFLSAQMALAKRISSKRFMQHAMSQKVKNLWLKRLTVFFCRLASILGAW